MHHIDALFVAGVATAAYAVGGVFWMGVAIATAAVVLAIDQLEDSDDEDDDDTDYHPYPDGDAPSLEW